MSLGSIRGSSKVAPSLLSVLLLPLLLPTVGCSLGGAPKEETTAGGFSYVRVGSVAIAGQPSSGDLADLEREGFRTIINARTPEEMDFDEGAIVNGLGMRYALVPSTIPTIEVGLLVRIRSIIESSPQPVVLHCRSGNRVALIWGMLEAGKRPDEEIIEIAQSAGLKSQYVPRLEEYLADHAAGKGWLRD